MKKLVTIVFLFAITITLDKANQSYIQDAISKKNSRATASTDKTKLTKSQKENGEVPYQNDDSAPTWKKSYAKRFYRMLGENASKLSDFKLESKKSNIKRKGRIVEHVIISYKKADGNPFSYEALIDQETGTLVQSWNKTRYEFNKPHVLYAKGKLYKE